MFKILIDQGVHHQGRKGGTCAPEANREQFRFRYLSDGERTEKTGDHLISLDRIIHVMRTIRSKQRMFGRVDGIDRALGNVVTGQSQNLGLHFETVLVARVPAQAAYTDGAVLIQMHHGNSIEFGSLKLGPDRG